MKKKIILIILLLIIIIFSIFFVGEKIIKENNNNNKNIQTELNKNQNEVSEDFDIIDEVSSENINNVGNIIVEDNYNKNNSSDYIKNETMVTGEKEMLNLVTNEEQENLKIYNIKENKEKKVTVVKGTLESKKDYEELVITLEYIENKKIKGCSSISLKKIKNGEKRNFEIKIDNENVSKDYKVFVEFYR